MKMKKQTWVWVVVVVVLLAAYILLYGIGGWGGLGSGSLYGVAVMQYGKDRIQFDMRCQTVPANPVYVNNTHLMLDNRSGDARTIALNGVQYHLDGYGWAIVKLTSKVLPAAWSVDCGSARNVSTITIQP